MTERKIVIKTCEECKYCTCAPNGTPYCMLPEGKALKFDFEIPEWCPLEENDNV